MPSLIQDEGPHLGASMPRPVNKIHYISHVNAQKFMSTKTWKLLQSLPFYNFKLHTCKPARIIRESPRYRANLPGRARVTKSPG